MQGAGPAVGSGSWRRIALGVAGCVFLLRLIYASWVELLPEETYYWNYAQHLDIGYLDHPPMVAWLIRIGTMLFGSTEFGVRCGSLCCGAVASVFGFALTRNVFGEPAAWRMVILVQLLPFFFMSGLLMTPDAPLTAAWAGTLYFLERALIAHRPRAWLWAGLSMGLGLLSKYTIGFLGIVSLVFMLADPTARLWFRRWQPYAAALLAVMVFCPVLIWNEQHEWASFLFQTSRRLAERPRFSLHKLIGGAVVLITPVGVAALPGVLLSRDLARARGVRLLRLSVAVPLAVYVLFSLRHEVKLDWTGAPWVGALPLLAAGSGAWWRRAWLPMFVVLAVFYAAGLCYLTVGISGIGYPMHTELVPVGWRDLGRQIETLAGDATGGTEQFLVVGMDRYAIASEVAFYASDRAKSVASTTASHLFGGVGLMYEQWFPPAAQRGRSMLLVAWDPQSLDTPLVRGRLDRVEPLQEGTLNRNGRLVRHFYYRRVHGYVPTLP